MTIADVSDPFEAERQRLFGIAYRMLGTAADADDIVQEAWLRWNRADDIDRPAAWLTTITTRLAIDRLRSARHRRETYVGPWLPEPLLTDDQDPAHLVELDESLTLGFLHVLDRLDPVNRAVFLLRDVFDVPYSDVADVVDKTEANCRQIARRARERVHRERPTIDLDPERRQELLDAFLASVLSGDAGELQPLLADDVVHISDGGPRQRAARYPVVGPDRVARLLTNLAGRLPADQVTIEQMSFNGQPGLVLWAGVPLMLIEFEFKDGLISRIHAILNPDKLAASLLAG